MDDLQNLTGTQYRFLQVLAGAKGSVVAAGDRNQCVGAWWGADAGLSEAVPGRQPFMRARKAVNQLPRDRGSLWIRGPALAKLGDGALSPAGRVEVSQP